MSKKKKLSTPAYSAFNSNVTRLVDLFQFVDAQIEATNLNDLPKLKEEFREAKQKNDVYGIGAAFGKYLTFKSLVELQHQWYAVMLVTITEAYLQDVLAYCSSLDQTLMKDSDQKVTYADLLSGDSIESLVQELRERWARNFLEKGGPSSWINKLQRMGARGYPEDFAKTMEQLWGIRHVVVHQAGRVTKDFVRRHSAIGYSVGEAINITGDALGNYALAVISFAQTTDNFFCRRYADSIK